MPHKDPVGGWHRIGIIVSVAWILGAGIFAYCYARNYYAHEALGLRTYCFREHPGKMVDKGSGDKSGGDIFDQVDPSGCYKREGDFITSHHYPALIAAAMVVFILPVPLGWEFAYLVLFLVRWVKRGFVS